MAALNFPANPNPNDVFTSNGKSWVFVNGVWKSQNLISLTSQVTGTLTTTNGGTGLSTVGSSNSLLGIVGSGTTLEYKSLSAGSGITISYSTGSISFEATNFGTVGGTGTTGTIPYFSNSNTLTDSLITQSGTMVQVTGNFKALTKSFKIPHPKYPANKILEHGSLEGPEHGAYQRGTAKGYVNVTVTLPEYWEYLVENNYNIILTPRGNYNLYIKEQHDNYFIVSKVGEDVDYEIIFDYFIIGERKDFKIEVIQEK
jgi:hypothetical protein